MSNAKRRPSNMVGTCHTRTSRSLRCFSQRSSLSSSGVRARGAADRSTSEPRLLPARRGIVGLCVGGGARCGGRLSARRRPRPYTRRRCSADVVPGFADDTCDVSSPTARACNCHIRVVLLPSLSLPPIPFIENRPNLSYRPLS